MSLCIWSYPAVLTPQAFGQFLITFPDVPQARVQASTAAEATANAAEALNVAILTRMGLGMSIPAPRPAIEGEIDIALGPTTAARAALAQAMRDQRVNRSELAATLGKTEGSVRRLIDGSTGVKLDTVLEALAALGQRAELTTRAA